jgi:4'-phosphopantetheinyl transferase
VDVVTVWLIRPAATGRSADDLTGVLDETEQQRAAAFARAEDRHRFEVVHGAARRLVGRRLGVAPAELRWTVGPYGKPELTDGLHVSLSYAEGLCLCAVATRPVGVDVQRSKPADAIAERFFPHAERRALAVEPDGFTRLWVRKEALVKAAGGRLMDGLRIPVDTPDPVPYPAGGVYRITDVPVPRGHHAAVALAGAGEYEVAASSYPPGDPGGRGGELAVFAEEVE